MAQNTWQWGLHKAVHLQSPLQKKKKVSLSLSFTRPLKQLMEIEVWQGLIFFFCCFFTFPPPIQVKINLWTLDAPDLPLAKVSHSHHLGQTFQAILFFFFFF